MHSTPILTAASALFLLAASAQASDLLSSGDSAIQQFGRYFLNAPGQVSGNDWQEVDLTFIFTLTAPLKLPKPGRGLKKLSTLEAWQYVSVSRCVKSVKPKSLVTLETTRNKLVRRLIVQSGQQYCVNIWNIS